GPLLLFALLLVGGGAAALGLHAVRGPFGVGSRVGMVPDEDAETRLQDVKQAFHRPGPLADDELVEELAPLFEELGAAIKDQDSERAVAQFDVQRMLDAAIAEDILPARYRGRDFVQGGRRGLLATFSREGQWTPWVG